LPFQNLVISFVTSHTKFAIKGYFCMLSYSSSMSFVTYTYVWVLRPRASCVIKWKY